jgi:hypothetical protein
MKSIESIDPLIRHIKGISADYFGKARKKLLDSRFLVTTFIVIRKSIFDMINFLQLNNVSNVISMFSITD